MQSYESFGKSLVLVCSEQHDLLNVVQRHFVSGKFMQADVLQVLFQV